MSDEQINRAIATFLEPQPAWRRNCRGTSNGGAWDRSRRRDPETAYETSYWHDEPRDFINDPACTVMLLEKLGSQFDISIIGMGPVWQVRLLSPAPESEETIIDAQPLGRAVALAFCRANGLNLEE